MTRSNCAATAFASTWSWTECSMVRTHGQDDFGVMAIGFTA